MLSKLTPPLVSRFGLWTIPFYTGRKIITINAETEPEAPSAGDGLPALMRQAAR